MIKKILFLLTFLLTTLGGGKLWAENYTVTDDGVYVNTSTGTSAFAAGTTYQATSNISMYIGSSGWTISSGNKYITGSDAPKYYNDTNWNYNSGGFPTKGAYLTFTPSVNGRFTLRGTKNGKSGIKYLYIASAGGTYVEDAEVIFNNDEAKYNSTKHGYPISETDDENSKISFTAEFNMTAGTTYYIIIEGYSKWSFTGFSFTLPVTTINVSDLNYSVGPSGKADAGLNRTVGGFNLAFDKGISSQGVKYNGGSSLIFLSGANGKMTVSMDSNNSSISITKILFNISSYANASTYLSVETGGGTLSKVSDTQVQWTGSAQSVTFAHNTSDGTGITLNSMVVTTSALPTYSKITPTVTLSPSSASIKVGTAGTYSPSTSSTPANFAWTWSHTDLTSTNVTYNAGNANSSDVGDAGSFTTTASSVAGTYKMSATFDGSSNPWFNSATISDAYTLTVQKNDLTTFAFNNTETYYGKSDDSPSGNNKCKGEFIDRTTTFKYKVGRSQVLRTRVDVAPGFDVTGIAVDKTNFGVSSDASAVLDDSDYSLSKASDSKIFYWGVKVKKPGTASLTYSFNGISEYNAKYYTEMFTIEKDAPVLAFASNFITKTEGGGNFTNTLTLNGLSLPVFDDYAGEVKATYESKNPDVATVDENTGQVTIVAPGVAIIEATVAESNWNNKATKSYTLVVNPTSGTMPDISWNNIEAGSTQEVKYNESINHWATASVGTVKYRIADTSIAELDNKVPYKVTGKGIGSTTVTAYVEPTSTHNYAEISYNVKVISAGELKSFKFIPNNGKVNNGKSITPKLAFPTIPASGVTSLKVTQIEVIDKESSSVTQTLTTPEEISNCDIIRVDAFDDLSNNWELDGVNKVFKVNVTINGKNVGKARITVTFESDYYNTATATYDVEVTDAGTRNFSWADGTNPEYYTYAGDFMMLPALTGNSNGNYNYSSGAKNSSDYTEGGDSHLALHAYEYERKWNGSNFNIKWNNKNIKIGEGFPDFAIVTEGISSPGTASVFFGRGEGGDHPDTLMVYCETAGDVKLRAYDPQDHNKYCDATIHILPISDIEGLNGSATTVKNGMTYPYTWDFTTDFNMAAMVGTTDQYWIPIKDNSGKPTGDYTNGYGFFNLDWADTNTTPDKVDRFYKYFIAGASDLKTGYMHQFNGMMLQMKGSTSWANKMDRMRILAYDNTDQKGRLEFIGGYHTMKLFLPGEGKRPTNFKIFVKASGAGHVCIMGTDEKEVSSTVKTLSGSAAIYSFDISEVSYASDGYILMGFEDAHVYWIAMSTEAKSIGTAAGGSDHMASYSYSQTMDYSKSHEANNVDAYVATAVTNESSASNPALIVTLQKSNTSVPSGTGVVLKATDEKNAYMIADARNVDSYNDPEAPTGNLLIGTGKTGCTIYELAGDETGTTSGSSHVPFYFSSKFRDYSVGSGIGEQQNAGYYAFWRVYGTQSMPANYSYMVLDADTYKDTYGKPANINGGASSRILLAFDESDDDSGTTGVNSINNTLIDSDAWYTLQGVRVNAPTKSGIYIHKGKKVVVK